MPNSLPAVRDLCPQFAIFARSSRSLPAVRDLCPQLAIFARSWRFFARICENKMSGVLLKTKTTRKLSTIARLHPHPHSCQMMCSARYLCLLALQPIRKTVDRQAAVQLAPAASAARDSAAPLLEPARDSAAPLLEPAVNLPAAFVAARCEGDVQPLSFQVRLSA